MVDGRLDHVIVKQVIGEKIRICFYLEKVPGELDFVARSRILTGNSATITEVYYID